MLMLPNALPWVPFGCHAELSLFLSEMGEGSQPCVCVCVCVCRSMMAGTVNTHRQLDTSSLRRENGAKRRTRCRTKTSKMANINLIDNILKKLIISTNLTKMEELR